jgi:hypothetical protein
MRTIYTTARVGPIDETWKYGKYDKPQRQYHLTSSLPAVEGRTKIREVENGEVNACDSRYRLERGRLTSRFE